MPVHAFRTLRAAGTAGTLFRRSVLRRFGVFLGLALPLVWLLVAFECKQMRDVAVRESQRDLLNLSRAFAEEVTATVGAVDLSLIQLRGWAAVAALRGCSDVQGQDAAHDNPGGISGRGAGQRRISS
jgi:hypothetical protein